MPTATNNVDSTQGNKADTGEGKTENKNQSQQQGTCAASCGVNQAYIEKGDASGTGATQVNANHIIQYPRQPKLDDGKWISIGSLIGSILGKFADNGVLGKAKDAENSWKRLNDDMHAKGKDLWDRAPHEWDKAAKADNDLENHHKWNVDQRDTELGRAEQLDNCNDALHEKLCQFAQCGYEPDYDGIKSRIMADVAAQAKKTREEACKNLNRYSVRQCCGIETAIATASIATAVGALYKAREDERARAWQINEGLLYKAVELMENHRNKRHDNAAQLDKTGINIQQGRFQAHNGNFFDLSKLGGEFLASAGKNYAWLAESYRKTADKMSGSLAALGGLIGLLLGEFLKGNSGENECK